MKYASAQWVAEAMLWQADYRDKIDSVPTGELDASGRTIVQSRNTAEADLWGFEAGLRYLSADERFEASAVVNHTRGEQTDGDGFEQPADRIPPFNGLASVTLRPSSRWWWQGRVRFAAAQDRLSDRDRRDSRIDPDGTPGWAVADLALGWQLNPALDLSFRIDNLFDKRYREHASGLDAPGRDIGLSVAARF